MMDYSNQPNPNISPYGKADDPPMMPYFHGGFGGQPMFYHHMVHHHFHHHVHHHFHHFGQMY